MGLTKIDIKSLIISRRDLKIVFEGERGPSLTFMGEDFPSCWGPHTISGLDVRESPPQVRTIRIRNRVRQRRASCGCCYLWDYEIEKRTLAFPYMQFYAVNCYGDHWPFVTWSREPMTSVEDSLVGLPLLPNVYNCANVCLGTVSVRTGEDVCKYFWEREFTPYEMTWPYLTLLEASELKSFDHWEALTREHDSPEFMMELICADKKFGQLVQVGNR